MSRLDSRRLDLRRRGDFLDDLDDVAVRVEDAQLALGAVAAIQERVDPFELALGAELARVRLDLLQRAADELRDWYAVPPARVQIHQRRLEPVARSEPLVLGRQDPVEGLDRLT